MSTKNTNLPVDQDLSSAEQRTLVFFNGYFDESITVDSSVHDTVYSFFLRQTNDPQSANAFTHSLITISNQLDVKPLDLLDQFGNTGLSVDKTMAALINDTRRNTSLIGLKQPTTATPAVARNILP